MKRIWYRIILLTLVSLLVNSCKKNFLDVKPTGSLNQFVLATDKGIDALLIGAYSMLDGVSSEVGGWESASSNWLYGSIRGMEANKGTDRWHYTCCKLRCKSLSIFPGSGLCT
jgi:hypothetical protein